MMTPAPPFAQSLMHKHAGEGRASREADEFVRRPASSTSFVFKMSHSHPENATDQHPTVFGLDHHGLRVGAVVPLPVCHEGGARPARPIHEHGPVNP